jgi:hypothetical protein
MGMAAERRAAPVDDPVHNPVGILGTQYLGVTAFKTCMSRSAKITGLLQHKTP